MKTKEWAINQVKELVSMASQDETKLYCVALEWTNGWDGEVIDMEYFTDKKACEECAQRMLQTGSRRYEEFVGGPATIYVQQYEAECKDLQFIVADSYENYDDEDFVMTECGVQLASDKYDVGGVPVGPLVKEITPEPEELKEKNPFWDRPYSEKGYSVGRSDRDDNVDKLTWMWKGRKFEAYGHLETTHYVRLDLHYEGEEGELHGLGVKWADPEGKEHDVFCSGSDIEWM